MIYENENIEPEKILKEYLECGDMTEKMVTIIRYRFGLDDGELKSLEYTAEKFGVTRERVRQIEAKLFKAPKKKKRLVDYLD